MTQHDASGIVAGCDRGCLHGGQSEVGNWVKLASVSTDEPPARPKSVTVLPTMPMTLVGKIFKPDLRQMAARAKEDSADHGNSATSD